MAFDFRCTIPSRGHLERQQQQRRRQVQRTLASTTKILCLSFLLALIITPATATITFVDTRRSFSSRLETRFGQQLADGYEYMGRLQYIAENPTLCPGRYPGQKFDVINPSDGLPVALVAQSGGCSIMDKIKVASTLINPSNSVGYLILQDEPTRHHKVALANENELETQTELDESLQLNYLDNKSMEWIPDQSIGLSTESLHQTLELAEQNGRALLQLPNADATNSNALLNGLGDITIAVLHVQNPTGQVLLDILMRQDAMERIQGGPRVLLNASGNHTGARTVVFWMLVIFSFCACGCACLLICVRLEEDEPEPQAPRRPVRRRLTLEEVRARFPSYHFAPDEHTQCCPNDAAAQPTGYMELSDECTICLDEFDRGVRVRKLPCGHVFHSTCIARWLIERSAVCPLCKLDLYIEPEDDSSSSSDSDSAQDLSPVPFWNGWFHRNTSAGYTQLMVPSGAAESTSPLEHGEDEQRSWWPFHLETVSSTDEDDTHDHHRSSLAAAANYISSWTRNALGRRQTRNEGTNLTELTEPLVPASSSMEEVTQEARPLQEQPMLPETTIESTAAEI